MVLAQALGETRDLAAVFVGELKVSGVRSRARIGVGNVNVRSSVSAELSVRLLSTRAGGTLWRSRSAASGTVGHVAFAGGLPSVAVRDTEEADGEMVGELVGGVTADSDRRGSSSSSHGFRAARLPESMVSAAQTAAASASAAATSITTR